MLERRGHQPVEQRVGLAGARFEFGVKLASDEIGMIRFEFDDFDQPVVRTGPGRGQSRFGEPGAEGRVEFVAVAVALAGFGNSVKFRAAAAGRNRQG